MHTSFEKFALEWIEERLRGEKEPRKRARLLTRRAKFYHIMVVSEERSEHPTNVGRLIEMAKQTFEAALTECPSEIATRNYYAIFRLGIENAPEEALGLLDPVKPRSDMSPDASHPAPAPATSEHAEGWLRKVHLAKGRGTWIEQESLRLALRGVALTALGRREESLLSFREAYRREITDELAMPSFTPFALIRKLGVQLDGSYRNEIEPLLRSFELVDDSDIANAFRA